MGSSSSVEASLLALASSTDNFMVGLSVGLSGRSLSVGANAVISACNAFGALVAGWGGRWMGNQRMVPPYLAPFLAAVAFAILAVQEFRQYVARTYRRHDEASSRGDGANVRGNLGICRALQLAIPMTINNLAGGVAGGAVGVRPMQAGIFALLASFMTMAIGHVVGLHMARIKRDGQIQATIQTMAGRPRQNYTIRDRLSLLLDPALISASLLGLLCIMALLEMLAAI